MILSQLGINDDFKQNGYIKKLSITTYKENLIGYSLKPDFI